MTQPFPAPQNHNAWPAPTPAMVPVSSQPTMPEHLDDTQEAVLKDMIEDVLKPAYASTLSSDIEKASKAYDKFEEANDIENSSHQSYDKKVENKKKDLADGFFASETTGILADHVAALPQTAQAINNRFYADLPTDQEGRRLEAIKPVLQARLKETYDKLLEEAKPFVREIIDKSTVNFDNDSEYLEFAGEIAQHCVDRLFLDREVEDNKGGKKLQIGVRTRIEYLAELGEEYKVGRSVVVGGVVLGARNSKLKDKADLVKEGQETLQEIAELIDNKRNSLDSDKDKLLSEWLIDHYGDGIDIDKAIEGLKGLLGRFKDELTKRFNTDDNLNYIKDTFIVPELENLGLIEKKAPVAAKTFAAPVGVPVAPIEVQKVAEIDSMTQIMPLLIGLVPKGEILKVTEHIGNFLRAGGDKSLLQGAYVTAESVDEDNRVAVIKSFLKIPTKPRTPKSN